MSEPKKLLLVAGARPNFMKIAPVIRELQKRPDQFTYVLVHTGQHYDEGMSDVFFRDLGIPKPDHYLNVGSGSHAEQTAKIMTEFEPVLIAENPDCVLVFGDVNSTLACSVVAKKLGVLVAHVEAGLRSGDMAMPEEINRMVTDAISDFFFVTEPSGVDHLAREGKDPARIHHVGHVMVDNLLYEVDRLTEMDPTDFPSAELKQKLGRYGVVTLHRPSNVDDPAVLDAILGALGAIAAELPLVFPVHPRTKRALERAGLTIHPAVFMTEPLGYKDFLNLWRDAVVVFTDSGGLQEETTALGVPCLTLRENTERPITVAEGSNLLVGIDDVVIIEHGLRIARCDGEVTRGRRPQLWDGHASERIVNILASVLNEA